MRTTLTSPPIASNSDLGMPLLAAHPPGYSLSRVTAANALIAVMDTATAAAATAARTFLNFIIISSNSFADRLKQSAVYIFA